MTAHRASPLVLATLVSLSVFTPFAAGAQGTIADYRRADGLRAAVSGLVVNAPEPANWIGATSRFWYRRSVKGGNDFVLVDAANGQKRAAFDHAQLAAALSKVAGKSYSAMTLPFNSFNFVDGEKSLTTVFDSLNWKCDLSTYACTKEGAVAGGRGGGGGGGFGAGNDRPRLSPDGKTEAFIKNFNIAVRAPGSTRDSLLSTDGSEGNAYRLQSIVWSPDSKRLAAYRGMPGYPPLARV